MTLGIRVSPWLWTPPNVMKKYEKHDWTIGNSAFVMGSLGIFFGTPQRSTILARWTGGVSPEALNHRPDKNAIGSSIGTWNGRWNQHDSEHLHGFFQHFLPLMFRCVFFSGTCSVHGTPSEAPWFCETSQGGCALDYWKSQREDDALNSQWISLGFSWVY